MKFRLVAPAYVNVLSPLYKDVFKQEMLDMETRRTIRRETPIPTYFSPDDVGIGGLLFTTNPLEEGPQVILIEEASFAFQPVDAEAEVWYKKEQERQMSLRDTNTKKLLNTAVESLQNAEALTGVFRF